MRMLQTVFQILCIFLRNLMQTAVHETGIDNYVLNLNKYKI